MKKTIVVFGATGKVGCYTALYLKEQGYDVIAVGRRKSDNGFFADQDIPYVSLDILEPSDYAKLPQENVYGIVHMAATLPATMDGYDPHEVARQIHNIRPRFREHKPLYSCLHGIV